MTTLHRQLLTFCARILLAVVAEIPDPTIAGTITATSDLLLALAETPDP